MNFNTIFYSSPHSAFRIAINTRFVSAVAKSDERRLPRTPAASAVIASDSNWSARMRVSISIRVRLIDRLPRMRTIFCQQQVIGLSEESHMIETYNTW
jgi:hypothetical protein